MALPTTVALPTAPVRLVRVDGLRYWQVDRCPYCGRRHRHGGACEVPPLGPRVANCGGAWPTAEYELVPEVEE